MHPFVLAKSFIVLTWSMNSWMSFAKIRRSSIYIKAAYSLPRMGIPVLVLVRASSSVWM